MKWGLIRDPVENEPDDPEKPWNRIYATDQKKRSRPV
jgi:hypothetical protein